LGNGVEYAAGKGLLLIRKGACNDEIRDGEEY